MCSLCACGQQVVTILCLGGSLSSCRTWRCALCCRVCLWRRNGESVACFITELLFKLSVLFLLGCFPYFAFPQFSNHEVFDSAFKSALWNSGKTKQEAGDMKGPCRVLLSSCPLFSLIFLSPEGNRCGTRKGIKFSREVNHKLIRGTQF